MKKAISLLVALSAALSMTLASFAAEDIPGTANSNANVNPSSRIAVVGSDETVTVGKGELFLADANRIVGVYDRLEPDTEYKFRIYWNKDKDPFTSPTVASSTQLTGSDLAGGKVRLRTVKGTSSVQSARISTNGRGANATYDLVINTRNAYGSKINEVEYKLDVTGSTETRFKESIHSFEIGYQSISDSETDIGEGGYITISNDAPVITKDQFSDIAKSVNYKNVNFEGEDGGWRYVNRVSGMPDSNFYYSYDAVVDLINKLPDQEYKFLSFKAGVTFPSSGEMRIDVSDIYDSFDNIYAYLYRNGKITPIDSTYDSSTNEIVFRTNYLGSFVLTDTKITDSALLSGEDSDKDIVEVEKPEPSDETGGAGSDNPNTGASSAMNIAVTLGLASLVTASALTRKKK